MAQSLPLIEHPSDNLAHASWQRALSQAIRDPHELAKLLRLPDDWAVQATTAINPFPLFVTREFAGRIEAGNPNDPLLRQVLPLAAESTETPGYKSDPVGDLNAMTVPGVLHKYHGRALLIVTGACGIHCRYCFRRHFPYSEQPKSKDQWQRAVDYLATDPSIVEVILSGGDPLNVVDSKLSWLVEQLESVPHLQRLRIHTRLPIVLPQRVSDELTDWLGSTRLTPWIVLHSNHANELDDSVAAAIDKLRATGAMLLNQSVLLAGVNDNVSALHALSERLIALRVIPYYLHQLDAVQGAAHFHVPIERGQQLITQLQSRLPGFAVPKYVAELAGQPNKTWLMPSSEITISEPT